MGENDPQRTRAAFRMTHSLLRALPGLAASALLMLPGAVAEPQGEVLDPAGDITLGSNRDVFVPLPSIDLVRADLAAPGESLSATVSVAELGLMAAEDLALSPAGGVVRGWVVYGVRALEPHRIDLVLLAAFRYGEPLATDSDAFLVATVRGDPSGPEPLEFTLEPAAGRIDGGADRIHMEAAGPFGADVGQVLAVSFAARCDAHSCSAPSLVPLAPGILPAGAWTVDYAPNAWI